MIRWTKSKTADLNLNQLVVRGLLHDCRKKRGQW
jgi:hypothetical protein